LTQHGRTLGPVFEALWAWGVVHLAHLEETRAKLTKSQDC
jgi:DNA-binding HxlR family transcriptional regulator